MDPALADFRAEYRSGVSKRYRGELHASAVFFIAFLALAGALVYWGLPSASELPTTLGVVGANIVVANFIIYVVHRHLGHHLFGFAKLFYQRHTKEHHRFFSPAAIAWESARDLRVVLFPVPLLVLVIAASGAVAWGVASLSSPVHASAVHCTTVAYYLAYEFVHFCDHLPEGHALTRVPGLRYMRAHHRAHHEPTSMHKMNFSIVFPLADWMFGTLIPRSELLLDPPKPSDSP